MSDKIKTGTYTGKGAIINVEVGFVPTYVKIYNWSDAGSLWAGAERLPGMAAASMIKTLKSIDSGSGGLSSQAYVTSNGISDFAGEAPGSTLVGTFAITAGASAITGTNTLFLKDLRIGDVISLGGNQYTVAGVTTATAATIVELAVKTETAANCSRLTGRAPGFTVGADADINAATEVCSYLALG